jgi:small subunit ribosomal protein S13
MDTNKICICGFFILFIGLIVVILNIYNKEGDINHLSKKFDFDTLEKTYNCPKKILTRLNIDPNIKTSDLTETNISEIRDLLETEEFKLEGNLKRLISLNIKRLIDINSFRGKRHLKGLPVRGQRTRTNNRTCRRQSTFLRKK